MKQTSSIAGLVSALLLLVPLHNLYAQSEITDSPKEEAIAPIRPDIELDPTPYFEHGYSGHAGLGWGHWRVEGEVLRTHVPEWIHGNPGFDVSYGGGGAKLQYFLSSQQRGVFVGTRTEIVRETIKLQHAQIESRPLRHDIGIDSGYRIRLGRHLYATPWGGVDYTFDAHSLMLAGRGYTEKRVGFFAAVHFGYRF